MGAPQRGYPFIILMIARMVRRLPITERIALGRKRRKKSVCADVSSMMSPVIDDTRYSGPRQSRINLNVAENNYPIGHSHPTLPPQLIVSHMSGGWTQGV